MPTLILGIETSCDDTAAAVIADRRVLSNIVSSQPIHEKYGGIVPELASRSHQQNIVPVVSVALQEAGIEVQELDAIAYTLGPGLIGSLLVGTSFAKGLSISLRKPLMEINHLHAHVLALFLEKEGLTVCAPPFPFLCLLISGGNSQIIKVEHPLGMEILGQTVDDAAGEAFDKCAKLMELPYPGGPWIDKLAKKGDPNRFTFARPSVSGLDYSFSGLKTSFLYFLRQELQKDVEFIQKNKCDLCASLQEAIIDTLLSKLQPAVEQTGVQHIALAGGVSANSSLRSRFVRWAEERNITPYIPPFEFTTDNAAMVAMAGYYKWKAQKWSSLAATPYARVGVS